MQTGMQLRILSGSVVKKDGETVGTTYTAADFTYHALTGKYTLKLEETAGEYIVEETAYDIDGYILKSVKYNCNKQ